MKRLRDQTSVHGSVADTEARLEAYFSSQRGVDGVSRLRLRVPLDGPLSQGLYLDREVRVEAWRDRDDQNLNDLIRITWAPEGRVIFPKFVGTLVVWGDDASLSYVELDGAYSSPLGTAGEIFDEAIGHRIAESTAREFLKDVKHGIEARSKSAGDVTSSLSVRKIV